MVKENPCGGRQRRRHRLITPDGEHRTEIHRLHGDAYRFTQGWLDLLQVVGGPGDPETLNPLSRELLLVVGEREPDFVDESGQRTLRSPVPLRGGTCLGREGPHEMEGASVEEHQGG